MSASVSSLKYSCVLLDVGCQELGVRIQEVSPGASQLALSKALANRLRVSSRNYTP
jgi:hypothetical protein